MTNPLQRTPINRPIPWRGDALQSHGGAFFELLDSDQQELATALERFSASAGQVLSPDTFKLSSLAATLLQISEELARGTGVAILSGFPVDRYRPEQIRTLYLGLSSYLGTATEQNGGRGKLREIKDTSAQGGRRVDSASALKWHNDRADVVGLLCVREPTSGGVSRLVSSIAIHNEMLQYKPDLLEVLFDDFERYAPGDEVGRTAGTYSQPVFMSSPQGFSTRYSRTYIDQAANLPDGKPLSCAQQAALNALVEVAEALSFDMRLKVGDIQYLNNHVILHGRTAFTDADADAGRLLYRVWLSTAHGDGPWSA